MDRSRPIQKSEAGGNKIIFSSGARFQLIDFLNVTDLNWAFLNLDSDLSMSQYGGSWGMILVSL